MWKIFNKIEEKAVEMKEYATPSQTDVQIIEEIHNAFDNGGNELLIEAKKLLKECEGKDLEKGKRMAKLGFTGTREAKSVEETEKLEQKAKQNAEIVQYYQNKYPNYKFITEEVVKRICNKYNLVFGECSQYKGNIPDKNLKEIESFDGVVKEEDFKYHKTFWSFGLDEGTFPATFEDYKKYKENTNIGIRYYSDDIIQKVTKFKICAPLSDMETKGYKLEGHKLVKEVPDPVVLFPVNGGYLIVSKWGLGGNDTELQNPLHN